jgi:hypothetical protein
MGLLRLESHVGGEETNGSNCGSFVVSIAWRDVPLLVSRGGEDVSGPRMRHELSESFLLNDLSDSSGEYFGGWPLFLWMNRRR